MSRAQLLTRIQAPALAGSTFDTLDRSAFTAAPYAAVRDAVAAAGGAAGAIAGEAWVTRVRAGAADDIVRSVVTELAVEPIRADGEDSAVDARYASALLARIHRYTLNRLAPTSLKSSQGLELAFSYLFYLPTHAAPN